MALNLDSLKRFVEEQMTDECIVRRDAGRTTDDTFNEDTGSYTPVDNNSIVYRGKCFVATAGWQAQRQLSAGDNLSITYNLLNLELGSIQLVENDVVEITRSMRSSELVGMKFLVIAPISSSFAVSSQYQIKNLYHGVPS